MEKKMENEMETGNGHFRIWFKMQVLVSGFSFSFAGGVARPLLHLPFTNPKP